MSTGSKLRSATSAEMSSASCPASARRAPLGLTVWVLAVCTLACVRGQQVVADGAGAAEELAAQTQTFLADKIRRHPVWASANRLDGEVRHQLGDQSKAARDQELAWLD